MPDLALVWDQDALNEYKQLIGRRKHKERVRQCVEGHLLAVSRNVELARPWSGPGDFRIYDFQCKDGETQLFLRATLQVDDFRLAVLSCNTMRF